MPSTFSGPRASAAITAVRAESMPPDSPDDGLAEPGLVQVVAGTQHQGVVGFLDFVQLHPQL